MRKFLSFIVLLSVCIMQTHGVSHTDADFNSNDHNKTHTCPICKTVSHQPILAPSNLDFNLSPKFVFEKNRVFFVQNIYHNSITKINIIPRAPPII